MARDKRAKRSVVPPVTEEAVEQTAESVAGDVTPAASRFRVRCADPTLRGYSVRGVIVPQGGVAIVEAIEPEHVRDVVNDRALVVEVVS